MQDGLRKIWKALAPCTTSGLEHILQNPTWGGITERNVGLYLCCDEQYRRCDSWRRRSSEHHPVLQAPAYFKREQLWALFKSKMRTFKYRAKNKVQDVAPIREDDPSPNNVKTSAKSSYEIKICVVFLHERMNTIHLMKIRKRSDATVGAAGPRTFSEETALHFIIDPRVGFYISLKEEQRSFGLWYGARPEPYRGPSSNQSVHEKTLQCTLMQRLGHSSCID